jgi:hypothetical protein
MGDSPEQPESRSRSLAKVRHALFLGAGISAGTGPNWSELTEELKRRFDDSLRDWYWQTIVEHARGPQGFLFPEIAAVALPSPSSTQELRDRIDQLQVERERLKSQLIALHRQVIEVQARLEEADRQVRRLERQNDGQLDCIADALKANAALQGALLARQSGTLCIHEYHKGVVTRALDDGVLVEFETSEGIVEHFYEQAQFVRGRMPEEGDEVEAHAFVWRQPRSSVPIEEILSPEEIEAGFEGFAKGITRAQQREES